MKIQLSLNTTVPSTDGVVDFTTKQIYKAATTFFNKEVRRISKLKIKPEAHYRPSGPNSARFSSNIENGVELIKTFEDTSTRRLYLVGIKIGGAYPSKVIETSGKNMLKAMQKLGAKLEYVKGDPGNGSYILPSPDIGYAIFKTQEGNTVTFASTLGTNFSIHGMTARNYKNQRFIRL